ncbi:MAG TPA: SHOCT domain-containing protein [Rhodocyclaceae bacterium]|nr:SHOCT domain-containing protein [Rhodocyclaceae bacterium]
MTAIVASAPAAVRAQTPSGPYGYGPQMMWGWGWYGMILGPLFMILMLAVVVAAVVLALRWLGGPWQPPLHHSPPGRTAMDILNERLARGEIDQVEYETKRRLISQG